MITSLNHSAKMTNSTNTENPVKGSLFYILSPEINTSNAIELVSAYVQKLSEGN